MRGTPAVADGLVFATEHIPAALIMTPARNSPVRRYLDAGGKIAWSGIPPLLWELDSVEKFPSLPGFKWDAPATCMPPPRACDGVSRAHGGHHRE